MAESSLMLHHTSETRFYITQCLEGESELIHHMHELVSLISTIKEVFFKEMKPINWVKKQEKHEKLEFNITKIRTV